MLKSWHVEAVLRCGGGLLELVDSVRCGACLELLCERGYSQLDSSGVGEAVSGYILLRAGALSEAIYYIYK